MALRAIKNSIIFHFVDEVNNKGEFIKSTTKAGVMLQASVDDSVKTPRWVTVLNVGPECEYAKPGVQLLLPALRWTAASKMEGESYWKTDESQAIAMRETETSDLVPLNAALIIRRGSRGSVAAPTESTIVVVSGSTDTAKATVISIGPKCIPELDKTVILFNDANMFDDFVHNDEQLSFIKEEEVIAYVTELA